jgi:hypothetical protein
VELFVENWMKLVLKGCCIFLVIIMLPISSAFALTLQEIGFWGGGRYTDFVASDSHLYVIAGRRGIEIIDIQNPQAPISVSTLVTPGVTYAIALDDHYSYLADGANGLLIVDVDNPAQPAIIGHLMLAGITIKVLQHPDFLVVLNIVDDDSHFYLHIVDIADPSQPQILNTIQLDYVESIMGLALQDHTIVMATLEGLHLLDVTDPLQPVAAAYLTVLADGMPLEYITDLVVQDGYAYLMSRKRTLSVVSIMDPYAPLEVARLENTGGTTASDMIIADAKLYIGSGWPIAINQFSRPSDSIIILDIANPAEPQAIGYLPESEPDFNRLIALQQNTQYLIALRDTEFTFYQKAVVDQAPPFASYDQVPANVQDIAIIDHRAFLANRLTQVYSGIRELDLSNPTAPKLINKSINDTNERRIIEQVAAHHHGVLFQQILPTHYSVPNLYKNCFFHTMQLAWCEDGYGVAIAVADQIGISVSKANANWDTPAILKTIDLRNPDAIEELGSLNLGVPIMTATASATTVYLGTRTGLMIVDISTPSQPQLISTLALDQVPISHIALAGQLAYVASTTHLSMIDVANPADPYRLSTYELAAQPYDLAADSIGHVYVAEGETGVELVDIKNPAAPVQVGLYDSPGSAMGLAIQSDLLYLADGANGLSVLRINDLNRIIYRFYNTRTHKHHYTSFIPERDRMKANNRFLIDEGPSFITPTSSQPGTKPVYQLYNRQTGSRLLTIDETERAAILNLYPWFTDEGIAYHAWPTAQPNSVPLYRFYNVETNAHFFTSSEQERRSLQLNYPQFMYEGIAYFVYPIDTSGI